jgi:hypothetical protein
MNKCGNIAIEYVRKELIIFKNHFKIFNWKLKKKVIQIVKNIMV